MGRTKGEPVTGLYVRDKGIRVPTEALTYMKAALWAWEVSTVRCEVRELRRAMAALIKETQPPSRASMKRQARAIAVRKGGKK